MTVRNPGANATNRTSSLFLIESLSKEKKTVLWNLDLDDAPCLKYLMNFILRISPCLKIAVFFE